MIILNDSFWFAISVSRWDGEEGGRGVQDGGRMYTYGRFMSVYSKNHYNVVISLQLKKYIIKRKLEWEVKILEEAKLGKITDVNTDVTLGKKLKFLLHWREDELSLAFHCSCTYLSLMLLLKWKSLYEEVIFLLYTDTREFE